MARCSIMPGTRMAAALLAASALAPPALAAQTPREAELEARLARLEAEVAEMRSALASAKQEQAATSEAAKAAAAATAAQASAVAASTRGDQASAKVAALEARPPAEGIRAGNTTIKIGGIIKLVASNSHFGDGAVATNSIGRDFYVPAAIPIGGRPTSDTDFSAKQTRLWLSLATSIADHQVKGYLETDFQVDANAAPAIVGGGSQRTTNGYTLALRRAWLQVDRLLIGQEWSNFQYVAALPESTDYVGATEGTVFVRQPQLRYTLPLSKALALSLSVENPESATATLGSPTLTENGTDHAPDFTARLAYASGRGEFSLAGLVRQVRIEAGGSGRADAGYGVSAAGKLFLNEGKTADIRFMATYGRDIGRYVGLNFAPDAVWVPATGRLEHVDVFAALVAMHLPIADRLRANLIGSVQTVDYANALPLTGIAGYNQRAFSVAGNLFYSPVKPIDIGIEFRHGERRLVSGAAGQLDRIEFAAKYSF